jgi:hypothetical protein
VLPDNAGANPIKLDGTNDGGNDAVFSSGTLLTLHKSRNTAGFALNADKIGVVLNTGITLTHTGTVVVDATVCNFRATICLPGARKFNYFEGTLNGSAGTGVYGIYINNNTSANLFGRFGPISISNYLTAGINLAAPRYTTFATVSVSGTTAGSGIVSSSNSATDIYFGDTTSSSNGSTISHHGINITGGTITFASITANGNAGNGVMSATGAGASLTVSGSITVNSNGTAGLAQGAQIAVPTISLGNITANSNSDYGVYFTSAITSGTVGSLNIAGSGTSYNKSYGVRIISSGVTYGAFTVTASGDATSDPAIVVSGANNTFGAINSSANTGIGLSITTGSGNTFAGSITTSNNGGSGLTVTTANTFSSAIVSNSNGVDGVDISGSGITMSASITANLNGTFGFENTGSNSTFTGPIYVSSNSNHNSTVSGSGNTYGDIYTANSGAALSGIYINVASRSRFGYIIASNNSATRDGVTFNSSNYNRFKGVLVTGTARFSLNVDGHYNVFGPSTSANNANGMSANLYSNIFLSPLAVNNTNYGIRSFPNNTASNPNTFVNAAGSHNGTYGIYVDTGNVVFRGNIIANGNTSGKCFAASTSGLVNTNCTTAGTAASHLYSSGVSDAILRIPATLASSFVGKVTSDDTSNGGDTNGTAIYSSALDFFSFTNIFRGWGKSDASAWPNTNHRRSCQSGTCQIWDWSLASADTYLLNRSSSVKSTCTSSTCPLATEVYGDVIGDDDGVCENAEDCYNNFNGDDNLNGTCESIELCNNSSGVNTFSTLGSCPVEVRGSEWVYSGVYTYDANYSSGSNGYQMTETIGDSIGDDDGVCEVNEVCTPTGSTCDATHTVCMQKFLKNAMEIEDTGGDSDYLCEEGETCLYTPNHGMYQGHGTEGTCTFVPNGGLTGITMYGYPSNGR